MTQCATQRNGKQRINNVQYWLNTKRLNFASATATTNNAKVKERNATGHNNNRTGTKQTNATFHH
jgi:hypothetical protein